RVLAGARVIPSVLADGQFASARGQPAKPARLGERCLRAMRNLRTVRSHQLRSGQLLGGLLTSLTIGAAATAAAIENWGGSIGLVVGGSALAVVTIVTTLGQQRMGLRRAEGRLLGAHVRVLDRGRRPHR